MAKFKLSLLLSLSLVFAFISSSNANSSGSPRHAHADLARMLKRRGLGGIFGDQPPQDLQSPSTAPAVQPTQATSTAAQTTPANSASAQTTSNGASASASVTPSTTTGGLDSVAGALLPTESHTVSSTVFTTTSSIASHSSDISQTPNQAGQSSVASPTQSTLYLTTSGTPAPTQSGSPPVSSGLSHTAVTILIVIAASVGAAIIVWTIIRKWKFRPSSDFEGRMQPVDWQPGRSVEEPDFTGMHRSLSRTSSFRSGPDYALTNDQTREPISGYDVSTVNPIPDHDFTAGPAHLTPVGGYADLARGPSPQPMMQEPLGRAPSTNRPIQYDQYGVPLHHGYSGY